MDKTFLKLLAAVLLLLNGTMLFSQEKKTVGGVVSDETGPVPGVGVMISGTTTGTMTDADGRYSIVCVKGQTIEFSCMGYETAKVAVGEASVYDVTLSAQAELLDQVVFVGYGVQKKVNVTGSVTSVDYAELATSRPVTNSASLLQGASAGLYVRQGSGVPGKEDVSLRIRGTGTLNNSDPLVIVDGVPGSMDSVDASEIQNISVLKDAASCAIYGNRGANGVILITTKREKKGSFHIDYAGMAGIQQPENTYKVVSNYADYMELMNEASFQNDRPLPFSQSMISLWRDKEKDPYGISESGYPNYVAYPNVDGMTAFYKTDTPVYQKHNLSVSGSKDDISYRVALGYMDNPGMVMNSGFKKFTYRAEFSAKPLKWLEVGARTNGYYSTKEAGDLTNVFDYGIRWAPCIYPYYDGKYGWYENPEQNSEVRNNLYFLNRIQGQQVVEYVSVTPFVNIDLPFGIKSKTTFRYGSTHMERDEHSITRDAWSFRTGEIIKSDQDLSAQIRRLTTQITRNIYFESDLSWAETFAEKHDVSAMVGVEAINNIVRDFSATKKGAENSVLHEFNNMLTPSAISGTSSEYSSLSFFSRLTYAYDSRYLVEVNLRGDGSSRFARRSRWGFFPSVSAAWRISKEKFMQGSGIDELKLRASYGVLGNNSIGNYSYQSTYSSGYSYAFGDKLGGGMISTLANTLLEWETTATANIGLDFRTFGNRLTFEADFYDKYTSGILYKPTISSTIGTKTSPYMNLCEVDNKGFEFTLGWRDQIKDFNYGISANFNRNWNMVTKYKGKFEEGWTTDEEGNRVWKNNLGDVTTGSVNRICEGHEINEYYLQENYSGSGQYFDSDGKVLPNGGPADGMIRTPKDMEWLNAMIAEGYKFMPKETVSKNGIWYGDYILSDVNGDGIYGDSNDYKWQGVSRTPKFYYGFNLEVGWKGINLSARFVGAGGGAIRSRKGGVNYSVLQTQQTIGKDIAYDHYFYDPDNPWDPRTNTTSRNPRLTITYGQALNDSNFYLYKTNYLKLQNVTLSYSFPKKLLSHIRLTSAQIYVTGENLYTFKDRLFPGVDPEFTDTNMYYSPIRQIVFGVNLKF